MCVYIYIHTYIKHTYIYIYIYIYASVNVIIILVTTILIIMFVLQAHESVVSDALELTDDVLCPLSEPQQYTAAEEHTHTHTSTHGQSDTKGRQRKDTCFKHRDAIARTLLVI